MQLEGDVAQAYASALEAIARVDGEINSDESALMRELVSKRTSAAIDYEALFFDKITADKLAARVPAPIAREVGRALVSDAVALATSDGDLNGAEGQAIVRFAHALGCTLEDVVGVTDELGEWLHFLG